MGGVSLEAHHYRIAQKKFEEKLLTAECHWSWEEPGRKEAGSSAEAWCWRNCPHYRYGVFGRYRSYRCTMLDKLKDLQELAWRKSMGEPGSKIFPV